MIVQATQVLPGVDDLVLALKSEFSNCSCTAFGSKPKKSVIVRKSALIGAQITSRKGEIVVDACYPNVFIAAIMSLLTASTIFPFTAWPDFERKITNFLKRKYS
ncbi:MULTISPECIES: hypothetical protein [unclassified Imperialibacter]|uniref:hypothetical protein n=1 Tax=unclassified Imperialibacter TaxID=2629706 RepID=UPI00125EC8D1|nr:MULTISPECIES: hypothetical protein [unclassified Imperialibacter]